jgi:hypothetical protein
MVLLSFDLELYRVIMSSGKLVGRKVGMIWRVLEDAATEVVNHAPFFIILDDPNGFILVDERASSQQQQLWH